MSGHPELPYREMLEPFTDYLCVCVCFVNEMTAAKGL